MNSSGETINIQVCPNPEISINAKPNPEVIITTIGIQGPPGPPGLSGSGSGGSSSNYIEKSADYFAKFSDGFIGVNCSDGPVTIYLPITVPNDAGLSIQIAKLDSTNYSVIIQTQEGQLIDGVSTSFELESQNDVFGMLSRGASYKVF